MSTQKKTRGFRIRRTAKDWIKDPDVWRKQLPPLKGEMYTARLTVDVTPQLRRKLRAAAVHADCSMSVIVRRLLEAQLNLQADPELAVVAGKPPFPVLEDASEAS